MNRTLIFCILLLLFTDVQGARIILDRIAVVVDEDVITYSEVEERIRSVKSQFSGNEDGGLPPDDVISDQVIERLIVETLQLKMGDRAGVRISDSELNQTLQGIAAQNQLSLSDFRVAIEADGISYANMREQIRREMIISQLQQGFVNNRIEISEQELKNFLASELGEAVIADEYRLAHILLAISEEPSAEEISEIRSQALSLIERVNDGESFQALAIEYSAGQNALRGGDLGWRKPVQLPTMFADVAQEMVVGETRGPIKSGSGFHLITLSEKRGAQAEGQVPQTRARHVLVKPSEIRSDNEARELAENLRNEVINGKDFDGIARLHSEDPGSALSGGDLGWTTAGIFVPEFEAVMNSLEPNIVSPVFKTSHGYHFLEVTGRRIEDFSEQFQRNMAENYLRSQKFEEELASWLREIRDEAFVDIRI
ncbi:MAG TPA: molecular chaperone SurA [Gammaproteobacteria bacterium]|nr:molecular chaperone SurA [Gammaproteobacteria bacterium]|tara:strand:- start:1646 stop:2926 length:1281 start_codon:yes stop_codon:yes gene_type:complete